MTSSHSAKVGAIIPAYNEGPRIHKVLNVLIDIPFLDRIVVVDDGSRDHTYEAAAKYNEDIELLQHESNLGKGAALQTGLKLMDKVDAVLFLDADLIGLTQQHLEQLLTPIWGNPNSAMAIGRFMEGRFIVDLQQKYFAVLNGQRALSRSFVDRLPDLSWSRFGVEVLLNKFANSIHAPIDEVLLHNITHVLKEEKFGFTVGFASRLNMYYEALAAGAKFSRFVTSDMLDRWPSNNQTASDISPKKAV